MNCVTRFIRESLYQILLSGPSVSRFGTGYCIEPMGGTRHSLITPDVVIRPTALPIKSENHRFLSAPTMIEVDPH